MHIGTRRPLLGLHGLREAVLLPRYYSRHLEKLPVGVMKDIAERMFSNLAMLPK